MKELLKRILPIVGIVGYSAIILIWGNGGFNRTFFGDILNFVGEFFGIFLFGLLAFVFVYLIYFGIKSFFKRKIQEEIHRALAKEKYQQYLREKERSDKQ